MRRRVLAASAGAGGGGVALAVVLAASPWRPAGWVLGVLLLGLLAPAVAGGGAAAALRRADPREVGQAARLTALGTPITVLVVLFTINVVVVDRHPGAQQLAALVLGTILSAYLAARFTATDEEDGH